MLYIWTYNFQLSNKLLWYQFWPAPFVSQFSAYCNKNRESEIYTPPPAGNSGRLLRVRKSWSHWFSGRTPRCHFYNAMLSAWKKSFFSFGRASKKPVISLCTYTPMSYVTNNYVLRATKPKKKNHDWCDVYYSAYFYLLPSTIEFLWVSSHFSGI